MDRFIEAYEEEVKIQNEHLKSNMDRFIDI